MCKADQRGNVPAQLLGRLYPQVPAKRQTAVQQFQEAARNNTGSASVWQMLGELLASSNVHGAARCCPPPLLMSSM